MLWPMGQSCNCHATTDWSLIYGMQNKAVIESEMLSVMLTLWRNNNIAELEMTMVLDESKMITIVFERDSILLYCYPSLGIWNI